MCGSIHIPELDGVRDTGWFLSGRRGILPAILGEMFSFKMVGSPSCTESKGELTKIFLTATVAEFSRSYAHDIAVEPHLQKKNGSLPRCHKTYSFLVVALDKVVESRKSLIIMRLVTLLKRAVSFDSVWISERIAAVFVKDNSVVHHLLVVADGEGVSIVHSSTLSH